MCLSFFANTYKGERIYCFTSREITEIIVFTFILNTILDATPYHNLFYKSRESIHFFLKTK